jgi:periplasmic protein CpxP/Spy
MAGALAAGMAFAQTSAGTAPAAPAAAAKGKAVRGSLHHRMVKGLGLTDAQKQQAKAIFKQTKTANAPLRAQLQQNRQALSAAVKANDIGQIRQLTQVQGNLKGQAMAARAEGMAKFYATLTPDQKTKADRIQQKAHTRLAQRRTNG